MLCGIDIVWHLVLILCGIDVDIVWHLVVWPHALNEDVPFYIIIASCIAPTIIATCSSATQAILLPYHIIIMVESMAQLEHRLKSLTLLSIIMVSARFRPRDIRSGQTNSGRPAWRVS